MVFQTSQPYKWGHIQSEGQIDWLTTRAEMFVFWNHCSETKHSFWKEKIRNWVAITSLWQPRHFKRSSPAPVIRKLLSIQQTPGPPLCLAWFWGLARMWNWALASTHHQRSGWSNRHMNSSLLDEADGVRCHQKERSPLWAWETRAWAQDRGEGSLQKMAFAPDERRRHGHASSPILVPLGAGNQCWK